MTAEARWNFIQWIQEDFKEYCEDIGDKQLNFTPNAFWHNVLRFDVKVTGTAKPKAAPPIDVSPPVEPPVEVSEPKPKSKSQAKRVKAQSTGK